MVHIDDGKQNARILVMALDALSDETNLRAMNLLLERECCVCEVMQALEISQPKASRHLSALFNAGFLNFRKSGLWSLYSINQEEMPDYLLTIVESVKKALEKDRIMAEDKNRLKMAKRPGVNLEKDKKAAGTPIYL